MPMPAVHITASSLIFKKTAMLEEMISDLSSDLEATQELLLNKRAELLALNERLDRVAASMAERRKTKVAGSTAPLPRTPSLQYDAQGDAAETPLPPTPPEKLRSSWLGSSKIADIVFTGGKRRQRAEGVSPGHPPGFGLKRAFKMPINEHGSRVHSPHHEPYPSKSSPTTPTANMHDPATTYYTPVTWPPREGALAPPTSPTRVVRDPIACAQQSIASEFDAQRRRIQGLESQLRSMRLALDDHLKSRPPQIVATTGPAPAYMPSSPGLASPSASSTRSRLGSSRTSMGQEDFFKLFLPMEARVGSTGGLEATAAASNGFEATEGERRSTGKLPSLRMPEGQAPSTGEQGSAGPPSSTSRANDAELRTLKARDASARGSPTHG
ncbi:hypothetical protein LTS09_001169 [Friedmanniomyces endolithicus]|nr:hypothetical protein LTS09_001169 [Friedmanniomyces endolithicus]